MASASDLRPGMAVRLGGEPYKVIAAESRLGGGKMGGVTHTRLRNLRTGTLRDWRFRLDEPVDPIDLDRQPMQFLYAEGSTSNFMNPTTFDQVAIENALLGKAAAYLTEGATLSVEFLDGEPVGVVFPDIVEVEVAETAPPSHTQGADNIWKEARLRNGVGVKVPPFIAPGEHVRVDVEAGTYVGRAHGDKDRKR